MSQFEFVTVMISMILALTVGRLLMTAAFLAKQRHRVVSFLPFYLWLGGLFEILILHWWSLWDLRDVEWTFGAFIYVLLGPTVIFFIIGLFSQDDNTDDIIDLEQQYHAARPIIMPLTIVYVLALWFDGPLLIGQHVFGPVGMMHIPLLAISILGMTSSSKRLHLAGSVSVIIVVTIVIFLRAFSMV